MKNLMMMIALLAALPAMAQDRVCVSDDSGNPELMVRVIGTSAGFVQGLQVFRQGELIVEDRGPLFHNFCHVSGDINLGKRLSLGGCGGFDQPAREIVADRKTGEIYANLTEMICHFE